MDPYNTAQKFQVPSPMLTSSLQTTSRPPRSRCPYPHLLLKDMQLNALQIQNLGLKCVLEVCTWHCVEGLWWIATMFPGETYRERERHTHKKSQMSYRRIQSSIFQRLCIILRIFFQKWVVQCKQKNTKLKDCTCSLGAHLRNLHHKDINGNVDVYNEHRQSIFKLARSY